MLSRMRALGTAHVRRASDRSGALASAGMAISCISCMLAVVTRVVEREFRKNAAPSSSAPLAAAHCHAPERRPTWGTLLLRDSALHRGLHSATQQRRMRFSVQLSAAPQFCAAQHRSCLAPAPCSLCRRFLPLSACANCLEQRPACIHTAEGKQAYTLHHNKELRSFGASHIACHNAHAPLPRPSAAKAGRLPLIATNHIKQPQCPRAPARAARPASCTSAAHPAEPPLIPAATPPPLGSSRGAWPGAEGGQVRTAMAFGVHRHAQRLN